MHVHVNVVAHGGPGEGVGSPGAVVIGGFELLGTNLGVLCKSSMSKPLHFSSPTVVFFASLEMHSLPHSETVLQTESLISQLLC